MKKYSAIFLFFLQVFPCSAQTATAVGSAAGRRVRFASVDTIGKGEMECIYGCTLTDRETGETKKEYRILVSGDAGSVYVNYNKYRQDSVFNLMNKVDMKVSEYDKVAAMYPAYGGDYIRRDNQQGNLIVYDKIFIDHYQYSEPLPDFGWQLADSVKTVCGYQCRKAVCSFRGREWTAWYADGIPVTEGPWKLGGLPGLILEAEDGAGELLLTAVSVRNTVEPITVNRHKCFRTTREKLNKSKAEYMADPGKYISASPLAPKDLNGKKVEIPKRKRFYVPFEKD